MRNDKLLRYILREKLLQERRTYRQFKILFNTLRPQLINTIQIFGAPVVDVAAVQKTIDRILQDQSNASVKKFSNLSRKRLKKDLKSSEADKVFRSQLLEQLRVKSTERASQIASTIEDFIRTQGTDTEQSPASVQKRASQFAQRFAAFSEYKSRQLAVTEVNRTVEFVKQKDAERRYQELQEEFDDEEDVISAGEGATDLALAATAASPVLMTKTWVAVLDGSTRPEHAAADGQEVGIDEAFDVGGEELMYPGDDDGSPENTINCRCTVVYSDGS